MAISKMAKVIIVSHRTEAERLLEALQLDGICEVLNAEEAMVSKALPELCTAAERPREIEELLGRLLKSIEFLKKYSQAKKGFGGVLARELLSRRNPTTRLYRMRRFSQL